jgi:hypothetical protein
MPDSKETSRRGLLRGAAAIGTGAQAPLGKGERFKGKIMAAANRTIARRKFGKTDLEVSIIGMGGYHLGAAENADAAREMVATALDAGINFFDNAWEYHDGRSEEWMGKALGNRRKDVILMTKVCTHGRGKAVAMQMLEESLRRLRTDHLDIWQIHEVIYDNDPDLIFAANGAAEALAQAKKDGKVRFVGFTGHKDPAIHLKMLSHGFPFDTVQMPLNVFDASFRSFENKCCRSAAAGNCGARDEEHGRQRGASEERWRNTKRSFALRHEPAGCDDDQRNELDKGSAAKSRNCLALFAAFRIWHGSASQSEPAITCEGRTHGVVQDYCNVRRQGGAGTAWISINRGIAGLNGSQRSPQS